MTDTDNPSRRFSSVARVHGQTGVERLWQSHAVVVGIGGVGSWAAEALARSGVGRLTLIDLDHVAESNINRQVHALTSTLGAAKVEVMAARILDMSPDCRVNAVDAFVEPGEEDALIPTDADVVVDAIDAVAAKASLIAWCRSKGVPVVVCGAAGGRTDPLKLRTEDLARTEGDALLSAVRARLRRQHGFPKASPSGGKPLGSKQQGMAARFGVEAVFSPEQVAGQRPKAEGGGMPLACAGYGSLVTVTAAMGLAAASRALSVILHQPVR